MRLRIRHVPAPRARTFDAPCTVCAIIAWIACAVAAVIVDVAVGVPPITGAVAGWLPEPGVMITSYWTIAMPVSFVAITVVRPAETPMRNRLVGEAGCTRAMAGSADMTV